MNHLAHLYLSRHSEKLMVGNFIADGVKGKQYDQFEREIADGILMHRAIDTFTDSHPIVRNSKHFFRDKYGLYAAVLIDLFYDHFLARNWKHYSELPLIFFSEYSYRVFEKYHNTLPFPYQRMLLYMKADNWLFNYAHLEGIQRSLDGMAQRIKNNPGIENSLSDLKLHYKQVQDDFKAYFPQLIGHVSNLPNYRRPNDPI